MSKHDNPDDTMNQPPENQAGHQADGAETAQKRPLTPAARRALAEAEARRKAQDLQTRAAEREIGGRGGADPARFGDWEINGRAIDF
jgi:hypothetical protein